MDPNIPPPTNLAWQQAIYLAVSLGLGAISALAALLGSERSLTWRVVSAYLIAGGLASVAVVLLLVEKYGFSYFLCGAGILAGYKSFDVLALLSLAISQLAKKYITKDIPPSTPNPPKP